MNRNKLKRANELITVIDAIKTTLNKQEECNITFCDPFFLVSPKDTIHPMSCNLSQYDDGSGWSINMNKCCVTKDVYEFTINILQKRLEEFEKEFEEL